MQAQNVNIDNLVLIVIDQLRADYAKLLPKCSELMPYSAICDANSIPTSTEAMHANISTGKYPKNHGFISKGTKHGENGLEQILKKLRSKEISSLALLGIQHGFKIYVIGGKPETVQVMGLPEECALRVYKNERDFAVDGEEDPLVMKIADFLKGRYKDKLSPEETDCRILEVSREIISKKEKGKSLFVLTLPSLDFIGHKHGPNSEEIEEHLKSLDGDIYLLIRQIDGRTISIVTGDHGCRLTTKYLIESKDYRRVIVYQTKGDFIRFHEEHYLDAEKNLSNIQYGGGMLRIWFREGVGSLSEKDVSFLSKYGIICPNKNNEKDLDEYLRRIYEKSKHENLGDITVFANIDTTFCKYSWIEKQAKKLNQKLVLEKGELPSGEHGTPFSEDCEVFFMSNYDFGNSELENIKIRDYIENLMKLNE